MLEAHAVDVEGEPCIEHVPMARTEADVFMRASARVIAEQANQRLRSQLEVEGAVRVRSGDHVDWIAHEAQVVGTLIRAARHAIGLAVVRVVHGDAWNVQSIRLPCCLASTWLGCLPSLGGMDTDFERGHPNLCTRQSTQQSFAPSRSVHVPSTA